MKLTIEIEPDADDIPDEEVMADSLEHIGVQLREGFTSGMFISGSWTFEPGLT